MLAQRHEIARLHSDFYRDQYHKLLRWLIYAAITILLLLFAIIYLIIYQKPQSYYANTTDGKILQMVNYKTGVR